MNTGLVDQILDFNQIHSEFEREVIVHKLESEGSASDFCDLDLVADLLLANENFFVHADYDADGICSAVIADLYLNKLHNFQNAKKALIYVPERKDGYGVQIDTLRALEGPNFRSGGILVTVDCGIKAKNVINRLNPSIRALVTDHHEPDCDMLPDAVIANPKLHPESFQGYSGAGVAYLVFRDVFGDVEYANQFAAIGTICDVMPCLGPNRAIIRNGIESIRSNPHPSLAALCWECNVNPRTITEEQIGWVVGPSINAAGRMGDAASAFDLFSGNTESVKLAVRKIVGYNEQRKKLTRGLASPQVGSGSRKIERAGDLLFLVLEKGFGGVCGLVAGEMSKRSGVAIAFSVDGDTAVGSCRSDGSVDCVCALSMCSDLILRYGGHREAAGFSINTSNIREFVQKFSSCLPDCKSSVDVLSRFIDVDSPSLIMGEEETIFGLRPYGKGFESPVFRSTFSLDSISEMGDGSHIRGSVEGHKFMWFSAGDKRKQISNTPARYLYTINESWFRGNREVYVRIKGIDS